MLKRWVKVFLLCTLVAGCEQSPIPDADKLTDKKPDTPEIKEVLPPYGLSVPDIMEFTEGYLSDYLLEAWVPAPGKALVTIKGLPEGATFNAEQSKISWKPSFDCANDPKNPSLIIRFYPVEVQVDSDLDRRVAPIRKHAVLIVKDNPRKFEFDFKSDKFELVEGKEFEQKIKIQSEDFPNGPFILDVAGLPLGAKIESYENHSTFIIRWLPWYDLVSEKEKKKKFTLEYKITNLRGQIITSPKIEWIVSDYRPNPRSSMLEPIESENTNDILIEWRAL